MSPILSASGPDADSLVEFLRTRQRLFVLTGAGCSTDSGIPAYRAPDGSWQRPPPIHFGPFMSDAAVRQRYWARSLVGWRSVGLARPNAAHRALAELEAAGRLSLLVTQNVDGLHTRAGSQAVIDLHGRLDRVRCMHCEARLPREALQTELAQRNPAWCSAAARVAPDGDAELEGVDFSSFDVPTCARCGGILKPDVVFYGESVPRERVAAALAGLAAADAMLVVGSSLMVYSGYRFALAAAERGLPLASVNYGVTRADALLGLKVEGDCGTVLARLARD